MFGFGTIIRRWLYVIMVTKEIIVDADRSCNSCVKNEVCRHFHDLEKLLGVLPQHGAPLKTDVMYDCMANSCLLFQKKKNGGAGKTMH